MKQFTPAVLALALTISFQNIFAQGTESYSKIANRLVELINAADYSGVENLFNKDMSKALPLEKATEFFTGLTEQVGKIQKLDQPKRNGEWTVFPIHCERGTLDMSLALGGDNKMAGLYFKPKAAASESAPIKHLTEPLLCSVKFYRIFGGF